MKNLFLLSLLCLLTTQSIAQDTETIVYDLNKGQFLSGQFSYLKPITIKGAAILGDGTVDAVQLTVTKVLKKEKETLNINELKIRSIDEEIKELDGQNEILITTKNIINNSSSSTVEDTQIKDLSKIGFGKLINTDTEKAEALDALKTEIDKLNKEISKKSNEKIKLQSKNINLILKLGNAKLEEQLWVRKGNETEFSISLQNTLKMTTSYSFDFKIFNQNNNAYPVEKLVNQLMFKVDSAFKDESFSVYTDVKIQNDVETTINKLNNELFSEVYSVDAAKSKVSSTGIKVNEETVNNLVDFFKTYRTRTENLITYRSNEANSQEDIIISLKDDDAFQRMTRSDSDELISLIINPNNYDESRLLYLLSTDGFGLVAASVSAEYQLLNKTRTSIKKFQQDSIIARENIQKQFEFIKSLYTKTGNSTFAKKASGTGETDLDGTRLGTVFGIGLTSYENNFFEAPGWFLYVGMKIRWDDFDNRAQDKKDRYKSWRSRFAVVVAMSYTSNMYYNGQKLNDTYLGFKPVIGLSFEPIKHMDIGAGIISFIPENTTTENMPEIRPYISLSFDFNLFNYLIQKK